eukprot:1469036-Lingulodinium_polyedra.AAC.1
MLGFACSARQVELRVPDLELPTLVDLTPEEVPDKEYAACLGQPLTVRPEEVREVYLATEAP